MISQGNADFWALYHALPATVRAQARQAFRLFRQDPDHPGLRFKKLNSAYPFWSVRFGDGYRAVGWRDGDTIVWLWVGTHQAFDKSFWMPAIFATAGPAETVALGRQLSAQARPGDVWALAGDLGAGKTHFVQGVVAGLGAAARATSPTFTLVHEYTGGRLPVFHFDFYRLETPAETLALGWEEYLDEGGGLTLVEWADKFPGVLPVGTRWFRFVIGEGDARQIVAE